MGIREFMGLYPIKGDETEEKKWCLVQENM